ncbi:hypothetical protein SISSUDRAFT_1118710, partial [Sistotremastrum suecicum HHB10207 ss-3]
MVLKGQELEMIDDVQTRVKAHSKQWPRPSREPMRSNRPRAAFTALSEPRFTRKSTRKRLPYSPLGTSYHSQLARSVANSRKRANKKRNVLVSAGWMMSVLSPAISLAERQKPSDARIVLLALAILCEPDSS